MEFWGIEVKPGKPVTCTPDDGIYFHVSQAALGELPKGGKGKDERIMVKVSVGKKTDVVIGTLVHGKCYQFPLDLIFDHEFTISHTGTSSNVYITGYKSDTVRDDDLDDSEAESDEEEVPTPVPVSGKGLVKEDSKGAKAEKAAENVTPSQVAKAANQVQKEVTKKEAKKDDKKKVIGGAKVEPPKDDSDDEEEDSDDDDDEEDDDEDDESDDDEMGEEFSDMDDSDEEDSSDEEESPKVGDKKRPGLTGSMAAPADFKKMKTGTPSAVKSATSKHEKASATPITPSTMKGQQNTKKFSGKKSPGSNKQKHRR